MHRIILPCLAALGLAACVAGQETPKPVAGPGSVAPPSGTLLSAEDYLALVRGNTIEGTSATAGPFVVHVNQDGSQRLLFWHQGLERRVPGALTVRDGLPCSAWEGVRGGAPRCSRIYKDGDTLHALWADDGTWNSSYRVVPGNPRNL